MVSIIIPAYNEGKRIGDSLKKLADFLKKRKDSYEVIVVDDASSDDTAKVAEGFKDKIANFKVLSLEQSPFAGKGWAVNKGVLAARGDIVLFTDADFSTPIEEIDKLLAKLNDGFEIAIGSRAKERSSVKKKQNPLRDMMGRVFNVLVQNIATLRGVSDTQCGFKAFKMPQSKSLFESQKIFDFGFDVELLFLARRAGLKIAEVPVLWFNDPRTTVHPIKDSYKMFIDLFKIRLLHAEKDRSITDRFFFLIYNYRTFFRFSLVGVSNTIVDYGLFFVLTRGFGLDALVANPISVEVAIIWSFIWNSIWTFSERKVNQNIVSRFLIFQTVSLGGLVVSQISLLILNGFLNIHDLLAKALTIPIVLAFNYLLNSRWTFRDTSKGESSWYVYVGLILFLLLFYLGLIAFQSIKIIL